MTGLPGMWDIPDLPGLDTDLNDVVRLPPSEFDDLIEHRGSTVDYWPSQICPCLRQESHRPRADCLACRGMGWIYPERLRQNGVKILLAAINDNKYATNSGEHFGGTANTCTFPSWIHPKPHSLILRAKQLHLVEELITHGIAIVPTANVINTRGSAYETVPRNGPSEDILRYPRIDRVIGIWRWSKDNATDALRVLNGRSFEDMSEAERERVRQAITPEFPSSAYHLAGNRIVWHDGMAPEPGDVYSVAYYATATYILVNPPSYRSDGDVQLQFKCTAVRYDQWGQNEAGSP